MTSNIGSQHILEVAGVDVEVERRVMSALRGHFRPEFLNRVDDIVIFHSLSLENLIEIVDIQLRGIEGRLAERGIRILVSDEAKRAIVQAGYDPAYGARPLKRALQQYVADPLAIEILEGRVADGSEVVIDGKDGSLTFALRQKEVQQDIVRAT